ncbi:hypothetical protein LY622_21240 [Halomonas sp. M5N1S17]|uniref:hypothetical protein n=1 Tax=Halomonas alkalisoli TaxID=2907158 RepID=UPI001F415DE8|nr:hypothetical protein [Halomonas alkalisoli]MCE9665959.1 hypothetical protein [Halomonas alkalisoli]MCE9680871.1 hypothetical protein [Halomonas alkalisoli]
MSIEKLTPEWGEAFLADTLAGDTEAALNLCVAMGNQQRGEAAVALWEMGIPAPAYRAFLQLAWEHDYQHVIEAAFLRPVEVSELFDYADFDTSALPERLTVWRGTAGIDYEAAAAGLSWTTNRRMACWFAMRYADRLGSPLVLRREVRREDVAMYSNERVEGEVVLLDEPDELPEVDGTIEEWRQLFKEEEGA